MTTELLQGDCLKVLRTLPDQHAQTCVTSPPYWGLRDYGVDGQLGLEARPEDYAAKLVEIFREVRRVLKNDGTLWLNLGDSYAARGNGGGGSFMAKRGHTAWAQQARLKGFRKAPGDLKEKDLVGIPWMVAFALRADGWYLRSDIIWSKPNPMPESVRDRPTKSHEYIFLLAKSDSYLYNAAAVKEPAVDTKGPGNTKPVRTPAGERAGANANLRGSLHKIKVSADRNRRTVWRVPTQPYKGAHFATYPPKLIRPCILAGSRAGDIVIDPFNGAGTTGLVAAQLRRSYIGIEINPEYIELTRKRLADVQQELLLETEGA